MSQRVELVTEMKEQRLIEAALKDIKAKYEVSGTDFNVQDGSHYQKTKIVKKGSAWAISGESYNVNSLRDKLIQTYAKLLTYDEARISGHDIVSEEVLKDGTIRLVLSASA